MCWMLIFLMSMLISGRSSHLALAKHFCFSIPSYALWELDEYWNLILTKSHLREYEVRNFSRQLFSYLRVLPAFAIEPKTQTRADDLTKSIDVKDREYVALALQLNATLLTRDKPLVRGLKKKGFRKIKLFDEFLRSV